MRSLDARLKRMEGRLLDPKKCACGGSWRVQLWIGDDPRPEPCPRCGTMGKLIHLVRGEWPGDDERPPEAP